MAFSLFKEDFEKRFGNRIYDFIDEAEYGSSGVPFNGKEVEELDQIEYDSYGNEDSKLRRIYFFNEYGGIYVEFYGTRQSYSGEDWDGYKEVTKTTKTIEVWT